MDVTMVMSSIDSTVVAVAYAKFETNSGFPNSVI